MDHYAPTTGELGPCSAANPLRAAARTTASVLKEVHVLVCASLGLRWYTIAKALWAHVRTRARPYLGVAYRQYAMKVLRAASAALAACFPDGMNPRSVRERRGDPVSG